MAEDLWPALPLAEWEKTYATLHMWTQVVGKVRLAQSPRVNHCWNSALYVTARGLTTSATPYHNRTFQVEFDFINHQLLVKCDNGAVRAMALRPFSVAEFYRTFMNTLRELGIEVKVWPVISHGFWPGLRASGATERERSGSSLGAPAFYSYTAPEPPGLKEARISPEQAFYSPEMKEWVLLYDDVRNAASPERMLLDFLQTTYEAGAELAKWDRGALERRG